MALDLAPGFLLGQNLAALSLVLLVLGHVLADFVFQSRAMVGSKDHTGGLLRHGVIVFLVHVVSYLPLLSPPVVLVLFAVALLHGLVDAGKRALIRRRGDGLGALLLDQLVHVVILVAAWWFFLSDPDVLAVAPVLSEPVFMAWVDPLIVAAVLLAVFALNGTGGAAAVSLLLDRCKTDGDSLKPEGSPDGHGRVIGWLERWLVIVFVLAGAWVGIGLVVAAKSIARFDRIRQDPLFAERYLVGTLGSLLFAVISGVVALGLIGSFSP